MDDQDWRIQRLEDRRDERDEAWEGLKRQLLAQDSVIKAMTMRMGELEGRIDTVCRNVSSLVLVN